MGFDPLIGFGISLAVSAISSLFTTPQKVKKQETSLRVPRSEYDSPLPKIYGKIRLEGNKFWPETIDKMYRIETETTSQGGKGGGGGGKGGQQTETDKVFGTWAVLFCEGDVSIERVIINGQEFETGHPFFQEYCTFFDGTQIQPWSAMQVIETGDEAEIAYKGICYIGFRDVPLEVYGNQIPTQIGAVLLGEDFGANPDVSLVVRDICIRAGIPSDKIDVTDITGKYVLNEGLLVSQNSESSRKVLEELMQFYLFTAVETTGGVITFKSYDRGIFTPNIFPTKHYLPINENKIFEVTRTAKSQLPNKASLRFYNNNQKYDSDTIVEYFEEFTQENDFRIETQISTNPYEARQQARKILKFVTSRQRYTYTFKLPALYYPFIELLGVYELPNQEIIQVDKITLNPDYTIDVSARKYTGVNNFLYAPLNPPASSSIPSLIDPLANGIPDIYFLDIPVINPNNPPNTIYICASAPTTINVSFDGGASYVGSVNHTATSTIGVCETVLTTANGLDTVNSLNIQIFTGFLSSISQTQFDTGSNLALVARQNNGIWEGELIQFRDVLPLGGDRYTISYLQRGVYNTSTFSPNSIGDKFFLLRGDGAYYSFYANTANIGQPVTFQPVIAYWQDLNITPLTTVRPVGNAYSPPAVTNIQSFIDTQNNIKITWDYNSTTSVFNTTQENITFEVDIEPSIRTIASTVKRVIYLNNIRNSDGVFIPFNINIYGVSSLVGRGGASFYTVDNPTFIDSTTFFDNPNSSFGEIVSVNTNLFQLLSSVIYEVDTSLAPLTLLMPLNPNLGDRVYILDGPGTFQINACILDGNGFNLEGTTTFSLNQPDEHIEFVFNGSQWIFLNRFFYANSIANANNLNGQPANYYLNYNNLTNLPLLGTASSLDVGTLAGDVLQFTTDNQLPTLNGSLLTDVNASKLNGQLPSFYLDRTNHTGTQDIITISGLQTALDALQPLLVNQINIKSINNNTLLGSGNLIIDATTISNFTEDIQDTIASFLIAGTNIGLTYNDILNTLTINSTSGQLDSITDGVTTINNVTQLDFNGATVVNSGSGIATINISVTGDMLKSIYDTNNDGVVNLAQDLAGIIPANKYYGTDSNGFKGFFTFPTGIGTGDMTKAVYDTNNNGIVDFSTNISGTTSASQYYGTNASNIKGFYNLPPAGGDMIKSIYDTNNDGIVDFSANISGITSASQYYGTNASNVKGFHNLPLGGDMLKSIYDTTNNGKVDLAEVAELATNIQGSPAINQYYGTNASGVKGFYGFPVGNGIGDMLISVYDTNNNNIVDLAENISGTTSATQYYGTNASNIKGFYNLPAPSGDMFKTIYDVNNDGVVDLATNIQGSPAINQYYGTNASGVKGFYSFPIGNGIGDMNKSVYDTNNDGIVDLAVNISGAVSNNQYYGSDGSGTKGFFNLPSSDITLNDGVSNYPNIATVVFNNATITNLGNNTASVALASSGVAWGLLTGTLSNQTDLQNALNAKQNTLVNQTNIKSINGDTLLGSGNLQIDYTNLANLPTIEVTPDSKISNYTLVASDYGKFIRCNGTFTITLPSGLTVGFTATIQNIGTGTITFSGAIDTSTLLLTGQYKAAQVYCYATNLWTIIGALS